MDIKPISQAELELCAPQQVWKRDALSVKDPMVGAAGCVRFVIGESDL
jgi:hypothetical protein